MDTAPTLPLPFLGREKFLPRRGRPGGGRKGQKSDKVEAV
jgi:hypothetical protein